MTATATDTETEANTRPGFKPRHIPYIVGGSFAAITALSYVGALTAQTGDPLMLGALLLGANGLPLGGRSVIFTLAGTAQTAVTVNHNPNTSTR